MGQQSHNIYIRLPAHFHVEYALAPKNEPQAPPGDVSELFLKEMSLDSRNPSLGRRTSLTMPKLKVLVSLALLLLSLMAPGVSSGVSRTITTFAGDGVNGFAGDGGPASQARIGESTNIATDGTGNVYIVDQFNHRIREVDVAGVISTIAGTGTLGFSGDGGPATDALLRYPSDVAIARNGDAYIADSNRVRRVDSAGRISTIAGDGTAGFTGDGGPASSARIEGPTTLDFDEMGNLYLTGGNRIRMIDEDGIITTIAGNGVTDCLPYGFSTNCFSGDGGPASLASLNHPSAIAFDSAGNLFFADRSNRRVRRIDSQGVITTIAGNGNSGFGAQTCRTGAAPAIGPNPSGVGGFEPGGIAIDANDDLYISAWSNFCVLKLVAGILETVAGRGFQGYSGDGGPATLARFASPWGIEFDSQGNLFVADAQNNRIRLVSASVLRG